MPARNLLVTVSRIACVVGGTLAGLLVLLKGFYFDFIPPKLVRIHPRNTKSLKIAAGCQREGHSDGVYVEREDKLLEKSRPPSLWDICEASFVKKLMIR